MKKPHEVSKMKTVYPLGSMNVLKNNLLICPLDFDLDFFYINGIFGLTVVVVEMSGSH